MKTLFFADIEKNLSEGIYKKILSQVLAFSNHGSCSFLFHENKKIFCETYQNSNLIEKRELDICDDSSSYKNNIKMINIAINLINENNYEMIYYRHSLRPSIRLCKLIRNCKIKNIKVICEIPTYPYFYEQVYNSNNKIITFFKMILDQIFWLVSYRNISLIVTIRSNSRIKVFKKMSIINNAIDKKNIKLREYKANDDNFNILGLGTICKYHGYDRIIKQIKKCDGKLNNNKKIVFHIVGESPIIDDLKNKTKKMGISENVIFHGKKFSNELNDIFNHMDIAVGCIALYRRHADIDTTLKVVEYTCRGIPFVSSGTVPKLENSENIMCLKISNNNSDINFDDWYNFVIKSNKNKIISYAKKSTNYFTWENNINLIIERIKKI